MQVAKSNASTAHETVDRIVNKLNQLIIDLGKLIADSYLFNETRLMFFSSTIFTFKI